MQRCKNKNKNDLSCYGKRRALTTEAQCKEKLEWLLGRLLKLVREDGRRPRVVKVTVRIPDVGRTSRQSKISPSLFGPAEADSEEILGMSLRLLHKMVDTKSEFQLYLMGLAVSDFEESEAVSARKSSSIGALFSRQNELAATKKRKADDDIVGTPEERIDEEVLSQLPPDIQEEVLSQMSPKAPPKPQTNKDDPPVPSGWDREVFLGLPEQLRKELLEERQAKRSKVIAKSDKPIAKSSTSRGQTSILQFMKR